MSYKRIEDRRAYHRAYMRDRRAWLKKHCFCADCKKQDAYTLSGHYRCFECLEKRRKTAIEYIRHEKTPEINRRKEEGFCHLCGSPWMEGFTKWGGEPIRLCERCYQNLLRNAKKGRDAYRERHGETWGQAQYRRSQKQSASPNTAKCSPHSGS